MRGPRILLVEDNPLTRGAVTEFLRAGGFRVVEAVDGKSALARIAEERPALVLQDMGLPDMDGLDLLDHIRAAAPGLPVLALTGLPGEVARADGIGGFREVLAKPISPTALLLAVRAHLAAAEEPSEAPTTSGRPRLLLVAPRDFHETMAGPIGHAGFEVVLAEDAPEALEAARSMRPEVVASFVILPRGDGFTLAHALRSDAALRDVPVVLLSDDFLAEEDRAVAERHGALDVVPRPRSAEDLAAAVRRALAVRPLPPPPPPDPSRDARRESRIRAALRRADARVADLERRVAFQSAALSLLGLLGESIARPEAVGRGPEDFLARCLAAAGTSRGLAFLRDEGGEVRLSGTVGLGTDAARGAAAAGPLRDLVAQAMESREPVVLPGPGLDAETAERLLSGLGGRSALVAPLVAGGASLGALVMVSTRFDLLEWKDVARAVSLQVGQAVALSRAVAGLAKSEARFRSLFEDAVSGMFRADPTGRMTEANRALAAALGYGSAADLLRADPSAIWKRPSDREAFAHAARGGPRFDGLEYDWRRRDGSVVRVRVAGRVLREPGGAVAGVEALVEDLTVRRAAEDEIRRAQRLDALRALAGGIAGDFNNLLTALAARAEFLERSLGDAPDLVGQAREIQESVARAGALVAELSLFARPRGVDSRTLDAAGAVEAAAPTLTRVLGPGIALEWSGAPEPLLVVADPGHLDHALLAMASQARARTGGEGRLRLEVAPVLLDAEFAARHPGVQPGPFVLVTARIEGARAPAPGAGPATSRAGESEQLGLAAVEGFAQQAGGALGIHDTAGTRVLRLYLPRKPEGAPAPVREAAAPPPEAPAAGPRGAVILLAEDEAPVRSLMAETLRLEGFEVLAAAGGREALALLDEHAGPLHLLVADVVMPGMNGRKLAAEVRLRRPGTRVLLVSGYMDAPDPSDPTAADPFLPKPFTPRVLVARVRDVFAAPHPAAAGAP